MKSKKNKLLFYLITEEIIETYGTMNVIENRLKTDQRFFKPHRSFMVNMDYIRQIDNKNIYMKGKFPIVPLSRNYYTSLKKTYVAYMVSTASGGNIL